MFDQMFGLVNPKYGPVDLQAMLQRFAKAAT
jgi:hypothetical protein